MEALEEWHNSPSHLDVTVHHMVTLQVDQGLAQLRQYQQHISLSRRFACVNAGAHVAGQRLLIVGQRDVPGQGTGRREGGNSSISSGFSPDRLRTWCG